MFYGRTSKKLDIKTYFDTSIEHNTRTSIEHPLDDGCLQGKKPQKVTGIMFFLLCVRTFSCPRRHTFLIE